MARVNRLITAAEALLAALDGKPSEDLTDLEYLARFGARRALHHHARLQAYRETHRERGIAKTREWVEANKDRVELTRRVQSLRDSIKRLDGKPATRLTDWPARRAAYQDELAQREAELNAIINGEDR